MKSWLPSFSTIILANGAFPQSSIPLNLLKNATHIICCDGAVNGLVNSRLNPTAIVGDMDSITPELLKKYKHISYPDPTQDTNDLTKTIHWCRQNNFREVAILGATGRREDHTMGNIFLLPDYLQLLRKVVMFTDEGMLTPIARSTMFNSFCGQAVSIFSAGNKAKLSAKGLKYPIVNHTFQRLWQGTLNEATCDSFSLEFHTKSEIIVFQKYA